VAILACDFYYNYVCYIKDYVVIDIKPQAAVVKIAQPTYMRSIAFKLKYEQLFENKLKFC